MCAGGQGETLAGGLEVLKEGSAGFKMKLIDSGRSAKIRHAYLEIS
jgi:hypothetical protein